VFTSLGSIVHTNLLNVAQKVPYNEMFAEWASCTCEVLRRQRHYPRTDTYKKSDSLTIMLLRDLTVSIHKRCYNFIPGMTLWKWNLLTLVLAAAVAFEMLSLWSYALRETMLPLPETVLKIVFRNTSQ
jgi:hypothetical protein